MAWGAVRMQARNARACNENCAMDRNESTEKRANPAPFFVFSPRAGVVRKMEALVARVGAMSVRPAQAPVRNAQKQGMALTQRAAFAATPVSLSSGRQAAKLTAQRAGVVRAILTEVRCRALTAPFEHRRMAVGREIHRQRPIHSHICAVWLRAAARRRPGVEIVVAFTFRTGRERNSCAFLRAFSHSALTSSRSQPPASEASSGAEPEAKAALRSLKGSVFKARRNYTVRIDWQNWRRVASPVEAWRESVGHVIAGGGLPRRLSVQRGAAQHGLIP